MLFREIQLNVNYGKMEKFMREIILEMDVGFFIIEVLVIV